MRTKRLFAAAALLAALLLTACTGKHGNQHSYTIEGTAVGFSDGDLLQLTNAEGEVLDTIVVKAGKFSYTGKADSVGYYSLNVVKDEFNNANFFTEAGTIRMTITTEPGASKVEGTTANDALQQLSDATKPYYDKIHEIENTVYSDTVLDKDKEWVLAERYLQLYSEINKKIVEAAEKNIGNELGYMLTTKYIDPADNADLVRQLIAKMPENYRQRQAIAALTAWLEKSEAAEKGKTIADFALATPEGTPQSILEEAARHKLTVLDFWASWCGPCRREMPFMKELHASYQSKGLGIIGISLDDNGDAWRQALSELKLPWLQLSDLKGTASEIAQFFQISAIPFTVVIDAQGTILEKGLRGDDLKAFVDGQLH